MRTHAHVPLGQVWAVTAAIFAVAALTSRALTRLASPMPAYWAGDVGLLAVAVALVWSWWGLGMAGAHTATTRRVLRAGVACGALLCLLAMVFPFL